MIRSLWIWLQRRVFEKVPETLAVCEFDCRILTCRQGEWERCARRLRVPTVKITDPDTWPACPPTGSGGRDEGGRA